MGDLDVLGWDQAWAAAAATEDGEPGRVIRQDRGWSQVQLDGEVVAAETRSARTGAPVVGDWVVVRDGVVVAVLDRRTVLRRADPVGDGEQVLAANLDLVLLVLGLDRPVKAGRVLRGLAQAWDSGAEPVAVLTKADLVADPAAETDAVLDEHPGLDVVAISARTGAGLDELRRRIAGATVVLLGESGAGKSSLLNALAGDDVAVIGEVRTTDAKGRHTTTRRELHVLPDGTIVVDTPGVRAMGLYVELDAVDLAFPDIVDVAQGCRFRDCTHRQEPGCAVRAAVDAGTLPADRLVAYDELLDEAEWAIRPDHERRPGARPARPRPDPRR